jgi:hypothetical protein
MLFTSMPGDVHLGGVGRSLRERDVPEVEAFTPSHHLASHPQVHLRLAARRPVAPQVRIEQARAAAAVAMRGVRELVDVAGMVHRGRRIVVVRSVVGVVVEGVAAQRETVSLPFGEHLTEHTQPVVHQRSAIEVTVAIVEVGGGRQAGRRVDRAVDQVVRRRLRAQGGGIAAGEVVVTRHAAAQVEGAGLRDAASACDQKKGSE